MYKMCKTEQSARRQRELELGLMQAMLQHQYEEITVSDLCDQIGIPRKSFYRYFSNKDGALHALIDHTLLEFETFALPLKADYPRTTQRDLEALFLFWQDHRLLLDALNRSYLTGLLFQRCIAHVLSDTGTPSRFLPQTEKLSREYAVMFGVSGLMSMVTQWHLSGFQLSAWQMAQITSELMTKPLFRDVESVK